MAKVQHAKRFLILLLAVQPALLVAPWAKADELLGHAPPPQGNAQRSMLRVKAAEEDIASGDNTSAAKNLQEAVALDPQNARAFLLIGYQAKQRGDNEVGEAKQKPYADALAAYQTAMKLDPKSAEAPFRIGELWRYQNNYEQAAAAYKQALAISPDYPEAASRLAEVEKNLEYRRKTKKDAAFPAAGEADEISPSCKSVMKKIGTNPAAPDSGKSAGPGFTSREMLALADHLKTASEQLSKIRNGVVPCEEAITRSDCYLLFLAKNPPVSSAEVGVFAAKGIDIFLSDRKAGGIDKARYPEALVEMLLSTLEHTDSSHFLASTLEAKGTADTYEKALAECTEKDELADEKGQLLRLISKKLDELEASHKKSGSEEEKRHDVARRKRFDALKQAPAPTPPVSKS